MLTLSPPDSRPPLRILVVEDEQRLRDMLLAAVPDMGFAVTGVPSGERALEVMERSPHDILLLDLRLPGMSGLDLCETVHQRWPDAVALILTGYGDLDAARKAIRLDVADFLTKPASLGEIEQALERARLRLTARRAAAAAPPADPRCDAPPPAAAAAAAVHTLDEIERNHILSVLKRHHGNRAATAVELGISLRTLYYRLAEYQRQDHVP
ncbi:MAG: response regulator [Planctomycetes bacterium]|nr:response regulator [Planctomycetota bacterium]